MTSFSKACWREQDTRHRSSGLKRVAYLFARPAFNAYYKRLLSRAFLNRTNPTMVLGPRGFPLETRIRWASSGVDVRTSTVLIVGTGTGWDVLPWCRMRPSRIVATDPFEFESWPDVARHCAQKFRVAVEFRVSAIEDLRSLSDDEVDICSSFTVFEHCKDLQQGLTELARVVRQGGVLFATYGPLWYCAQGDHFSGRDGLHNAYNHLLLSGSEYRDYFARNLLDDENYQSGGRYVQLDMFSKLRTAEYLDLFEETGWRVDGLVLEISPVALAFRRLFPDAFSRLRSACAAVDLPDDLLVKSNTVRLMRRD